MSNTQPPNDRPKRTIRLRPMPAQKSPLDIEAVIDIDAFEMIKPGYRPKGENDKWLLLMQNNEWLHFFRIASGACIFQARFAPQEDGQAYTITEAWVNRDPEQYRSTDFVYDSRLMIYLIRHLLLGHDLPIPTPKGLKGDNARKHQELTMGESQEDSDDQQRQDNGSSGATFIPINLIDL